MVGQIKHHLYRKRGFYYFCRRVPKTLLDSNILSVKVKGKFTVTESFIEVPLRCGTAFVIKVTRNFFCRSNRRVIENNSNHQPNQQQTKQPEHEYVSFTVSDYAQMLSYRCVYWEGMQKSSGNGISVYRLIVTSIGKVSNGTYRFYYTVKQ